MYELYGLPRTRTFRVLWMLEELGAPYTLTPTPPASGEARALNPSGKIPILRFGDTILTDSVAIMTFLADRHGGLTAPAGTAERGLQDAITQFVVTEMDAVLWTAAKHSFALPETWRCDGLKPTLAWEFARAVAHLSDRMGDAPFLTGDRFTIADILATHCGDWAQIAGMMPDAPAFAAYLDRMRAREAYGRLTAAG